MNLEICSGGKRTALILLFSLGCLQSAHAGLSTQNGKALAVGNGTVNTYVTSENDGTPVVVGIRLSESALEGLPTEPNNTTRCFDRNGDGKFDAGTECLGEYETFPPWPADSASVKSPFKWLELDWNAHGHGPPGVYDKPHFDVHFYMVDRSAVEAIRPGPCGDTMVHCDDYARAKVPVKEQYVPAGYIDVGAVVAAMGNHLVNTASPELATPPQPFTHTLIYGAYDGRLTFIEPMLTRDFLLTRPDSCWPIAQPGQWSSPGFYPTEYCIRYSPDDAAWTISLEGFKDHTLAALPVKDPFTEDAATLARATNQ